MRARTAIAGIIILLVGAYLLYNISPLVRVTNDLGITSQSVTTPQTLLLTLPHGDSASANLFLSSKDTVSGWVASDPPGIDFFIMSQSAYSSWASNNSTSPSFYVPSSYALDISNSSFSFNPQNSQNYFFVFVSHSTSNADVVIHYAIQTVSPPSLLRYVPFGLLGIGLLLTFAGAAGGRKKRKLPIVQRAQAPKRACRFCGQEMSQEAIFCPSCKKSQV